MARYELGAIYKIPAQIPYYARLLSHDVYGIFERTDKEICHETFEKTPYRLYISTGSFAVKRGFWKKFYRLRIKKIPSVGAHLPT